MIMRSSNSPGLLSHDGGSSTVPSAGSSTEPSRGGYSKSEDSMYTGIVSIGELGGVRTGGVARVGDTDARAKYLDVFNGNVCSGLVWPSRSMVWRSGMGEPRGLSCTATALGARLASGEGYCEGVGSAIRSRDLFLLTISTASSTTRRYRGRGACGLPLPLLWDMRDRVFFAHRWEDDPERQRPPLMTATLFFCFQSYSNVTGFDH